jgi:hypothetical protein
LPRLAYGDTVTAMAPIVPRFRWAAWWAAAALVFQASVLVLQTPMEVARGLGHAMVAADHCTTPAPGHHGNPSQTADPCDLCLGMLVAGQGLAPVAPALPLSVSAPEAAVTLAGIPAPPLDRPTPQNPRAPPLPA